MKFKAYEIPQRGINAEVRFFIRSLNLLVEEDR
jgi:hypothetical protein